MRTDASYISIVCLCGAYLKANPTAIGKLKICPSCHHTLEVRSSANDKGRFSTLFLKADKISTKGKARWKLTDGFEGFVEQVALKCFEERGWKGLWSENSLWEFLMALLFWDVFFAPLQGVWAPMFTPGSTTSEQDQPYDWGKPEFYERRRALVSERLVYLRSASLHHEIARAYSAYYGRRCRPIWNWDSFSSDQLALAAMAVPRVALLKILTRLLKDYGQNRSGIPDLLLWKPGRCAFVEVKGSRDRLSKQQIEWLEFFYDLRLRSFVLRVE